MEVQQTLDDIFGKVKMPRIVMYWDVGAADKKGAFVEEGTYYNHEDTEAAVTRLLEAGKSVSIRYDGEAIHAEPYYSL
ncbi:MAG: hypothetical protein OXE50_08095 [Chloroflexi bacterium]|nr:hypothetical protein [Chloroflexota bacterium]